MAVFVTPLGPPNASHSPLICSASSRVGASISAMAPSPGCSRGCATMCVIAGSAKQRVLPEPVAARPMRSHPLSATGQHWLWIGVGARKFVASMSAVRNSGNAASRNVRTGLGAVPPETCTRCFRRQAAASSALIAVTAGCSM